MSLLPRFDIPAVLKKQFAKAQASFEHDVRERFVTSTLHIQTHFDNNDSYVLVGEDIGGVFIPVVRLDVIVLGFVGWYVNRDHDPTLPINEMNHYDTIYHWTWARNIEFARELNYKPEHTAKLFENLEHEYEQYFTSDEPISSGSPELILYLQALCYKKLNLEIVFDISMSASVDSDIYQNLHASLGVVQKTFYSDKDQSAHESDVD